MRIERMIRGYSKESEDLEVEWPVPYVPLAKMREVLNLAHDDPLYDCYPVDREIEDLLRTSNTLPRLDYESRDYFLECRQVET